MTIKSKMGKTASLYNSLIKGDSRTHAASILHPVALHFWVYRWGWWLETEYENLILWWTHMPGTEEQVWTQGKHGKFLPFWVYFYFMCLRVFYLNVYLCTVCVKCRQRPEKSFRACGTKLQMSMSHLVEIEPGTSARAPSGLNHRATSSVSALAVSKAAKAERGVGSTFGWAPARHRI